MKITIDTDSHILTCKGGDNDLSFPLYSKEAFDLLSHQWLKLGWSLKYAYQFTWLGRPIIQLPDDLIRIQEILFSLKPDVLIETGVAYGGSLIFYASLFKLIGKGRAIGVEKFLRPHNREEIEKNPLFPFITLIEGDSTNPKVVKKVQSQIKEGETVLVILDSNHSKKHVLKELEAYSKLVTPGSYLIATDGLMKELHDAPHGNEEWIRDNPASAVSEFVETHPEFEMIAPPAPLFNKSHLDTNVTQWLGAWLRRKS